MATERIQIIVSSKGTVTVKREIEEIGGAAKKSVGGINMLKSALAGLAVYFSVGGILATADAYTTLQNRLKLVTGSAQELTVANQQLAAISRSTYSSFDSTVTLFTKVAGAYKTMGKSTQEATKFTELFQKAAILSGSSLQTTQQAVYQFTQALNKGKLDGDEFKSVLEGLPYVASLLQQSLGVTRAELYEMSADGEISINKLTEAFMRSAKVISGDFAGVIPTVAMALQQLNDSWLRTIGVVQEGTGIFSALAYAILFVADNLNWFILALSPVALALLYLGGELVIGLVILAFTNLSTTISTTLIPQLIRLNAFLWANPYLLVAAAVIAIVAAIVYWRKELGLTDARLQVIQKIGVAAFAAIKAAVLDMWQYVKPVFENIVSLVEVWIDLNAKLLVAWQTIWAYVEPVLSGIYEGLVFIVQKLTEVYTFITVKLYTGWKFVFDAILGFVREVINVVNTLISALKLALSLFKAVAAFGAFGGGANAGAGAAGGATTAPGMREGGQFTVGGTGAGTDQTPVNFNANRGERVTVETKKQQRQADNNNSAGATEVKVPLSITNVLDPGMVPAANESASGQRSIVNVMRANRDEIIGILGIS